MDAISFVFGVQSRELRSNQMKDLIFRAPGTQQQKRLRASATIIYQDTVTEEETHYSRTISPTGVGDYRVNGSIVTFKEYEAALAEIGVLLKARNFLVFQGDVESIARKTPKEFVELLENISGSAELKEPYEEAMKAKDEAEAGQLFLYNKQKGFKNERRILKEQKEEAERFHAILEEKSKLQTDMYLWLLHHLHQDMKEREDAVEELSTEMGDLEKQEHVASQQLKQCKKQASAARRETAVADKKRIQLSAALDKLEPAVIQATEEIKDLIKKVATDEKQLQKLNSDAEKHSSTLATLDEDINEYKKTRKQLEIGYAKIKRGATDDVTLTEEQEAEYDRVREAAAAASDEPRRVLTALNRKLEAARAKAATKLSEYNDVKSRHEEVVGDVKDFTDRKEKLTKSLHTTKADLTSTEKELQSAQKSAQEAEARREELDKEIEKVSIALRDVRDDHRKGKDEDRLLQAIASLKRHFPGVQGRLVDLCRPTQRRFNLAVTVAGGKDMDAIVVDTKQTGFDCLKYLRDNRIGVATFLPLDTLQVPSPENAERVRAMTHQDGRYRLAADVIACDESVKRAVLYAVGTTVICDDLDAAREICFGGRGSRRNEQSENASVKAVTIGGAVISKAGTMTGGVTTDDANRAGRFEDDEVEKLREKKDSLERERADLDSVGARGGVRESFGQASKIEELRSTLGNLRNRNQYSRSDLEYTTKQLGEKQSLLESTKKQMAELQKQVDKAEKDVSTFLKSVNNAIQAVKEAEDEHLGPFRELTGLRDLKAYEEAVGKSREEYNQKKRSIMEHITKLEQQKDYETGRDFMTPIARCEKRLHERKAKLELAMERASDLEVKVTDAKAALTHAESIVKEAVEKEKSCDDMIQTAQIAFNDAQTERNKLSKAMTSEESALERLRGKLHETLQKARVEEVYLPVVGISSTQTGKTRASQRLQLEDEEMTENTSDRTIDRALTQETAATTHFSQADDSRVVKDRKDTSKIDFSQLNSKLKQRLSDRDEKKVRKDFEDRLSKFTADIEGMTPNMKAGEAFEAATERMKDSTTEWDQAKCDSRKATLTFQKIKSQRAKLFNNAFEHIDEALKTIYTDMTKSSKHPLGGSAYLSLDDTEEPYKGGMKFNAMPPLKRFRDMEQLSGGEKTVAALSLIFAIHSFRPAPVLVMDEVDAALDNVNIRKVCNYVSQRAQTDFQCIVISLKDMFYERSQSLVGICRDVGTNSSKTLTLDLTKFADDDDHSSKGQKRSRASSISSSRKRSSTESVDAPAQ